MLRSAWMPPFSFLTNHALVLLQVAHDPHVRMRDIAAGLGITERATQRIVGDLVESGYVTRTREGRRNVYDVRTDLPIEIAGPRTLQVGELLEVLAAAPPAAA
jgi:hypothetical protein